MDESKVKLKAQGSLAYVEFFHPKANALSGALLKELTHVLKQLGKTKEFRVIILTSSNEEVFSSGAFLDELLQIRNLNQAQCFFYDLSELMITMITCPKPIIGSFLGKAVGGGVGILSCCDQVIASEEASIRLSEISIAIAPLVIEPIVSHRIGISNFITLSLNPSHFYSANWAKEAGLISKLVKQQEVKLQVEKFARELSTYSPEGLFEIKKMLWGKTQYFKNIMKKRMRINSKFLLSPMGKEKLLQWKKL